jgi:hypothetical protein
MLAQASTEFLVFVSLLLILVFLVVYKNYQSAAQLEEYKSYQEAQNLVNDIAFEINLALKAGDGYSRKFYVSKEVYGISNFTIEVSDYQVKLKWDKGEVSASIFTRNITGTIKAGENVVRNVKGEIYVE